jgi:phosphoglycerol transferase MdoB-like AlkP superfamily enzyme
MDIRAFRIPLTLIMVVVFLLDLQILYHLWAYKPWTTLVDPSDGIVGNFKVVSIWKWTDLVWMSLLIVFQITLAYLTYRSWAGHQKRGIKQSI